MRLAITGASGFMGTAVRARLAADGHHVLALRRRARPGDDADWDPPAGWTRPGGLDGVDAVVNLAGEAIVDGRWTAQRRRALVDSRVALTRVLVDWIARSEPRPRVLVSTSAIGYYGDRGDEPLDEGASQGRGFLAELAGDWEAAARAAEPLGVRVVLLRSGHVLQAGGGLLGKLELPFRIGVGGRLGSGRQWMSWIAMDDMVSAILHAIATDSLAGPVNGVGPAPVTNADFTRALGAALRRPTLFPVPAFALRVAFGAEKAADTVLASQRVLPRALEASGFRFAHATLEDALAWAYARR